MVGRSWIFNHSIEDKTVKSPGPQPLFYIYCRYWFQIFFKVDLTGLGGKPNTSPFVLGLCLWVLCINYFSTFLCLRKWEISNYDECYKRGEKKKIQSVLGKSWGGENSNLFCQLFEIEKICNRQQWYDRLSLQKILALLNIGHLSC